MQIVYASPFARQISMDDVKKNCIIMPCPHVTCDL